MLINNCRLISFLPFFSKLFERFLYNKLIDLIEKHQLLYQCQFGVNYKHTSSAMKQITCGVPQNSIFGPSLFEIYIYDIASVSQTFFKFIFR